MSYNLLDHWKVYTRDFTSPDSFIEMSLYSMIAAALQRKVWLQSPEFALFANLYLILCGPPGIGKGLVIKPAGNITRHHKINPIQNIEDSAKTSSLPKEEILKILEAAKEVRDYNVAKQGEDYEEPLLIPATAQATTFESLVQVHAKSISSINLPEACPFAPNKLYRHSSLYILLEEMSSLFKKRADDLVQYLIAGYDCLDEFKYQTKHNGRDRVKRGCINLLAGTTPKFLQDSSADKLLDDGFFSRVILVYEDKNRFEKAEIGEFSPEQELAKREILAKIYEIACVFGQMQFTQEATEFLKHYIEKEMPGKPTNPDPVLESYYSRKKVHIKKLSIAVHFSRSLSMTIDLDTVKYTVNLLNRLEEKMHLGLKPAGRNPLASISSRIVKYMKLAGPQTYNELLNKFEYDLREEELAEILKGLEQRKIITKVVKGTMFVYTV